MPHETERVPPSCSRSRSPAGWERWGALEPVGHGFVPKGGGWFIPAVVGGVHLASLARRRAVCGLLVLGLLDRGRPWRVEHLDLLALAGLIPVALLLSDDLSAVGLWLAANCPVPWVPKTHATG
jgi:hypothetical protein